MSEYAPNGSDYSQIKVASLRDNPVGGSSIGRVLPRQVSTGNMRGTQTIGGDGVIIDSSNERIGVGKIQGTDKYQVQLTSSGLVITDGIITFISITKDGLIMNDGTNDRVLIGKDPGGF